MLPRQNRHNNDPGGLAYAVVVIAIGFVFAGDVATGIAGRGENVAHRQGFKSLKEVDRCVLDPGGVFFIEGKAPPLAERQHAELLIQLEQINKQLSELRRGEQSSQDQTEKCRTEK